jgi:hypothetical protein
LLFLALLVLALYHMIIIAYNLTTNEHVREYYGTTVRNPYQKTLGENYRQVCCAPYGFPVSVNRCPGNGEPLCTSVAPASSKPPPVLTKGSEGERRHVNGVASEHLTIPV